MIHGNNILLAIRLDNRTKGPSRYRWDVVLEGRKWTDGIADCRLPRESASFQEHDGKIGRFPQGLFINVLQLTIRSRLDEQYVEKRWFGRRGGQTASDSRHQRWNIRWSAFLQEQLEERILLLDESRR
jgi:hypothetical protein